MLLIAICLGDSGEGGLFAFSPRIFRNSLLGREIRASRLPAPCENGGRERTFPS